ncbi:MAG: cytochrome c oxidase accessory protein CcoG [Deltaproteobacteria bacterium CG_4_10_14_0_2_um_filter_43_8]|nr:MAG: cytochrome c oxidase accessory protein CcoG [Deltaproteobacteria bacterium CG11_big_fil_rev_8_21_14_0_20_42_23]PJA22288.1 MAG: cytochrome c oxidase accessory protein CcoG [Deltaproteobacteria bacterium CG_4_10_14_0_2_um_filter_43_8]PJC64441.1 MAG: cytochrome c oxidase accessory protein CcoG [Deltaproteobacteria bacterium CG_4_9_14_0_2_um_filter_42_21]
MENSNDLHQRPSSIRTDGKRIKIRIADVKGIFQRWKKLVFLLLIFIYAALPWIKIGENPLVFIDVTHRKFFLFGLTFNAQDFYLVFFVVTGIAFSLFYLAAVAGRLWCGWACPHTVFLEGVFRRIERWIEGPRSAQLALEKAPWNIKKLFLFSVKHFLFFLCALVITHIFLSYFISLPILWNYMQQSPYEHWPVFVWMMVMTGIIYLHFAWFREQLCLIVCPYGRIQSALADDDTLVIGYDYLRGEPRGKKNDPARGACINCHRCVDVCPTGIDIREGMQLECVGCANCIDACNEIMIKIGQAPGLIRYDSLNGLLKKTRRIIRPRLLLYNFFFFLGVAVFSFFVTMRKPFEANTLRALGQAPYVLTSEGNIRNQFIVHIANKGGEENNFFLSVEAPQEVNVLLPITSISLKSLEDKQVPFFVEMPAKHFSHEFSFTVKVKENKQQRELRSEVLFLGPSAQR